MKIRKKPVVVNGWRISDLLDVARMGAASLPKEVREAYKEGLIEFETDRITIATREGVMTGWPDWWLIQGVTGTDWYPCEGDIFDQTYEVIEADEMARKFNIPSIDPYASSPEV